MAVSSLHSGTANLLLNFPAGSSRFALESEVVPPSWVYIELIDHKTNTKYKSALAETTQ